MQHGDCAGSVTAAAVGVLTGTVRLLQAQLFGGETYAGHCGLAEGPTFGSGQHTQRLKAAHRGHLWSFNRRQVEGSRDGIRA